MRDSRDSRDSRRDPPILPPQGIGGWWLANSRVHTACMRCGHRHEECPAVMAYAPKLDFMNEYPQWRAAGWLVWWECPQCGHVRQTPTPAHIVAAWGGEGWQPMRQERSRLRALHAARG